MSFYPTGEDKAAAWWWLAFVLAAMALLTCMGCSEVRTPPVDESDPAAVLGSIGATLAWAGGISAAAGLGLSLISLFYPPLQPFAVIFRLIGIGGAGVSATGAVYLWIATHFWWILALAALVGSGIAWWCWPRIHKLIDRRMSGKI